LVDRYRIYEGRRILVTGGAGSIGSNLIKAMLKASPSVLVVLDDFSSSERWNLPSDSQIVVVDGSILDEAALEQAFSFKPEYVFHMAAHFANQNSIEHPEADLSVNGMGTLKLLERSQLAGVSRFIFASSSCSVYGSEAPLPLKEDFVSLHMHTPYQVTKLLGELYCNFFHDFYGLPTAIARYFNVYGPGEIPGRYRNVISNFMMKALLKESLPITGTGDETRDFTFVSDAVDGTMRLGATENAVGETFNLATGIETRIMEIAEIINDLTGNPAGVEIRPKRAWDRIERRRASIEKARKLLRYEPKTPVKEGIRLTYDWFMANSDNIRKSKIFV
jgi:UDP-glucose 4-epimerase